MKKPGWLLSPSFCLDAILLSFNIFIHSLLFSFISQLILFIICPYLWAWQSILHSASADRWKNDPCLTLPSITSLLPSLLSSWSPSETRLTACYISSSHSNPPSSHPHDRAFSLQCTLFPLQHVFELQQLGMRQKRGDNFQNHRRQERVRILTITPAPSFPVRLILPSVGASFCRYCTSTHIYFTMFFPSTPTLYSRITWRLHADTGLRTWCISRAADDYCVPTMHGGRLRVQSKYIKALSRWGQTVHITSLHDMPELSGKQG